VLLAGLIGTGGMARLVRAQQEETGETYPGKEQLINRGSRPLNLETPLGLLDQEITPNSLHFVRNHGAIPAVDAGAWRLTIDGEVERPLTLSLAQLREDFPVVTEPALIECGGNGRAFFSPPVPGNQWERGAIGCARWTGVRLGDLLRAAGLKPSAVYLGCYGLDDSLNPQQAPRFSRGIPIDKAMEEHTLVAFQMNGEDLPIPNGYPARLVVPGWVGSASQKWLTRIWVRDRVHDSPHMQGMSYRNPAYPVAPGAEVPLEDMEIVTAWPVKSMITHPAQGAHGRAGAPLEIRGFAWAGEREVKRMELSFDLGRTWNAVDELRPRAAQYAWYRWFHRWTAPGRGYHEIWARAWDSSGEAQPLTQPWNPRGYMGNVVHRVPVQIDPA
jgi:DMSO/TMAO reductase YedYZ molybdopterin-dependent catalytic subunit